MSVQALHNDLSGLDLFGRTVESAIDKLTTEDPDRLRAAGLWLVRHGTDRRPVMVGLALLVIVGRPEDAPLIRTIGLLDHFGPMTVRALAALAGSTPDLIWLAERSRRWARIKAIEALTNRTDPPAAEWLRHRAVGDEPMGTSLARQVAEAVSLADALQADDVEDDVVDQAAELLLAMAAPGDYRTELAEYRDACRAHDALARCLTAGPASMRRYAMLVSLIADLRSGSAACLDWNPGQRESILTRLRATVRRDDWCERVDAALRSPDPLTRRQAEWARKAVAGDAWRPAADPAEVRRLRIEVAVPDPLRAGDVQTRILVDGRPVVAAAFDKGPPHTPETLLERGRLRAAVQAHEVRLAEAYCTEGCCGALHVTVVRDRDTVVWRDWRGHTSAAPPPEPRFAADQYDAELTRAETDRTWEWPARTVARVLRARLAAEPNLLSRWQCELGWIWAGPSEPSQVQFTFCYPERPTRSDADPWIQFMRVVPIDAAPPDEQVARILGQMVTVDPKTQATVVGGTRDYAEQLGYAWPGRGR